MANDYLRQRDEDARRRLAATVERRHDQQDHQRRAERERRRDQQDHQEWVAEAHRRRTEEGRRHYHAELVRSGEAADPD
jgi:hypothetical protein